MDRITGNVIDLGGGLRLFRGRDLALGISGTIPGPGWFNDVQEEIVRCIEWLGLTPAHGNREQLIQAMRRLAGGNVRSISADVTLTADDAGVVLVSAAGGSRTITLPAAHAAGARPLRFTFIRTDTSPTNTVTIQRAGANQLEGGTSLQLAAVNRMTLVSDGAGAWYVSDEATTGRSYPTVPNGSGWHRLPGGLIVQFGHANSSSSAPVPVTYPVAFPTLPIITMLTTAIVGGFVTLETSPYTTTGFSLSGWDHTGARAPGGCFWLALGR